MAILRGNCRSIAVHTPLTSGYMTTGALVPARLILRKCVSQIDKTQSQIGFHNTHVFCTMLCTVWTPILDTPLLVGPRSARQACP